MPDRRGFRYALEALYLGALAVALAFSALNPAAVVAVMLGGWALIVASEWASAASRPHYAAGLPPRWHVPAFTLPPAQPLEQVAAGYPEPELDEAATWIASAAVREELLSEWPVLLDPEDTQEADWIVPLPALAPDPEPEPEPEAVARIEPAPVAAAEPVVRMARYHVDPFEEPERGRFGRQRELPSILVPAKPARDSE